MNHRDAEAQRKTGALSGPRGLRLHVRRARRAVTLLEMLVAAAVMAFALVAMLKAVIVARNINDRGDVLTRLMLRAHSEIEERKAAAFDSLRVGETSLLWPDDRQTTGVVAVERLPNSEGLKITVELVSRSWRGDEAIRLSALRFPEAAP